MRALPPVPMTGETLVAAARSACCAKLAPDAIDLWLLHPDDLQEGAGTDRCRALLSAAERARERRFVFARDQHTYLLTRAFVRTVLGQYLSMRPQDLVFQADAHGRLHLAGMQGESPALAFNLSHTRGLILLGVGCGRALGVDAESLDAHGLSDIADQFLAPGERVALSGLDDAARHERHLETWTLKEAYAKARSIGLALPMRQCAFAFDDGHLSFTTEPGLADPAAGWHFWQCRVNGSVMAAVCGEMNATGGPSITVATLSGFARAARPLRISHVRSSARPAVGVVR